MEKRFLLTALLIVLFIGININSQSKEKKISTAKLKVTFIELGSVNCIPCKQMQPVMKAIEKSMANK